MLALYLTIWIALALFVAGEVGRSVIRPRPWAWWAFAVGLCMALVHTAIAFDVVHNWVHDDAVRSTAQQTEAMFGMAVGWGVYVNYLFFAVWLADAWWWRAGVTPAERPPAVTWMLRAFYLVIILNAAVIFAAPARRALGLLVVALLAWAWRPHAFARR
jgi:hypothetical protein